MKILAVISVKNSFRERGCQFLKEEFDETNNAKHFERIIEDLIKLSKTSS